jgi:hypothetical protein
VGSGTNKAGKEMNTAEYLQGANDCLMGIEHKAGKGQSYDAGYSSQYQHEQNLNALTGGES